MFAQLFNINYFNYFLKPKDECSAFIDSGGIFFQFKKILRNDEYYRVGLYYLKWFKGYSTHRANGPAYIEDTNFKNYVYKGSHTDLELIKKLLKKEINKLK